MLARQRFLKKIDFGSLFATIQPIVAAFNIHCSELYRISSKKPFVVYPIECFNEINVEQYVTEKKTFSLLFRASFSNSHLNKEIVHQPYRYCKGLIQLLNSFIDETWNEKSLSVFHSVHRAHAIYIFSFSSSSTTGKFNGHTQYTLKGMSSFPCTQRRIQTKRLCIIYHFAVTTMLSDIVSPPSRSLSTVHPK